MKEESFVFLWYLGFLACCFRNLKSWYRVCKEGSLKSSTGLYMPVTLWHLLHISISLKCMATTPQCLLTVVWNIYYSSYLKCTATTPVTIDFVWNFNIYYSSHLKYQIVLQKISTKWLNLTWVIKWICWMI